MSKTTLAIIAFSCATFSVKAQTYTAVSVPDTMRVNANVVYRLTEEFVDIKDAGRIIYSVHSIYTIFNKDGADELAFRVITSAKRKSLENVEIKVFDDGGMPVGKYNKKDVGKVAYQSGLVEDGMLNYFDIPISSYPATVDIRCQERYYTNYSYPSFKIDRAGISTENASFRVRVPVELGLRYDIRNLTITTEKATDGGYETYSWSVKNLTALKKTNTKSSYYKKNPEVVIAPNNFEYFNTKGNMSSWKSLGQWGYDLADGLEKLPSERMAFFRDMVKNAGTDAEKVALVYRYLQDNFRYISIQLGIGGMKPFPAKFTDEKKYGDCKALSFFMYSVLKELGIKSHIAWINAGYRSEPVNPAFPDDGFNHVVLCIPRQSDSLWLECTSSTADFAVLGGFTENRYALLLTKDGGVLVPTPRSKSNSNVIRCSTKVELSTDGSGQIHSFFALKGDYREVFNEIMKSRKDDQKAFVTGMLNSKQPDDFVFHESGNLRSDSTRLDILLDKVPQFIAGSKMFMNSRVYSLDIPSVPKEKYDEDFYLQTPGEQYDSTFYQLPEGYTVEVIPKNIESHCAFGDYSGKAWFDKDTRQVVTVTSFVLKENRIPASKYSEAQEFLNKALADQQQKIIIKPL
jgi:Domain of Unknown Function with PDB structure (DUF3857)